MSSAETSTTPASGKKRERLPAFGVLTAMWLEGGISYLPGYLAAGPDIETDALVEVLASVNRAGLVTDFSQPGASGDGFGQRMKLGELTGTSPATYRKSLWHFVRHAGGDLPVSKVNRRHVDNADQVAVER